MPPERTNNIICWSDMTGRILPTTLKITCSRPIFGRHVSIQSFNTLTQLTLCEVNVLSPLAAVVANTLDASVENNSTQDRVEDWNAFNIANPNDVCFVPSGFFLGSKQDRVGDDIGMSEASVALLASSCLANSTCKAFNTNGVFKSNGSATSNSTFMNSTICEGLMTKMPLAGEVSFELIIKDRWQVLAYAANCMQVIQASLRHE